MKKLIIYGLLTGLFIAGWTFLEYLLGFHTSPVGRYTGMLVFFFMLIGLLLGIRAYRDQEKNGLISYWQAVLAGISIAFFAGLVYISFMYAYYTAINPGLVDFIVEKDRALLRQRGATAAQITSHTRQIQEYYQILPLCLRAFGGFITGGAIFSLIMAALLKKQPQQ